MKPRSTASVDFHETSVLLEMLEAFDLL